MPWIFDTAEGGVGHAMARPDAGRPSFRQGDRNVRRLYGTRSWRLRQIVGRDRAHALMDIVRVLFVCTGNLCRSPMAQAVGQCLALGAGLAMRLDFESAGTHAPQGKGGTDPRARDALRRAGYAVENRRARRVTSQDFASNDLILAMDHGNLQALQATCPPAHAHKLRLLLDFAPGLEGQDVPDPYFGNPGGFDRVMHLCEAGVRGLLGAAPTLFGDDGARGVTD
jgi:protein-tyrosine phosphatase